METQQTVQRQNVQIELLERQNEQLQLKIDRLTSKSNGNPPLNDGKAFLYRSCEEIRAADPESESGGYWIDPDGVATGDPPIFVQCDMTTGSSRYFNFSSIISFLNRIHFDFTQQRRINVSGSLP